MKNVKDTKPVADLRGMEVKGLQEELKLAEQNLFAAKFEVRNGSSKRSDLVKAYKNYVAQIKTVIATKQLITTTNES